MRDESPRTPKRYFSFEEIAWAACTACGAQRAGLGSPERGGIDVLAREIVVVLARRYTMLSYPEIAAKLHGGGHSSQATAYRRAMDDLDGLSAPTRRARAADDHIPESRRAAIEHAERLLMGARSHGGER